jgi:hypothetical protein
MQKDRRKLAKVMGESYITKKYVTNLQKIPKQSAKKRKQSAITLKTRFARVQHDVMPTVLSLPKLRNSPTCLETAYS